VPELQQALFNLAAVLAAAGLGMEDVVKTTLFLVDLADGPTVNAAYGEAFSRAVSGAQHSPGECASGRRAHRDRSDRGRRAGTSDRSAGLGDAAAARQRVQTRAAWHRRHFTCTRWSSAATKRLVLLLAVADVVSDRGMLPTDVARRPMGQGCSKRSGCRNLAFDSP
jgi:hypothetical protein